MKKVTIYTDGACSGNPGPGGYAAIMICGTYEKEISGGEPNTTNNRMELKGPIEALKLLKEKCEVDIYSDSSYVVNCFNEGWIYNWHKAGWTKKGGELKNIDLLSELYSLCQKHIVTWHKVKGHSDNEYNNKCDKLAVAFYKRYLVDERAASEKNTPTEEAALEKTEKNDSKRDGFYEGELSEKVISSDTIFRGRVFSVKKCIAQLPDRRLVSRELVEHNGGASIVAIDEDDKIYLVEQFRFGAGKTLLELPAGKLEEKESPKKCAERELLEETGMRAEKVEKLAEFFPTPAYDSEKITIYLAKNLVKEKPHRDEGEFLHVIKMDFQEAFKMAKSGKIQDAKTIIGIMTAWEKMKKTH